MSALKRVKWDNHVNDDDDDEEATQDWEEEDDLVRGSKAVQKRRDEIRPEKLVFKDPYLMSEIAKFAPSVHTAFTNLTPAYRNIYGGERGRDFRRQLRKDNIVKTIQEVPERTGLHRITTYTLNGKHHNEDDLPAIINEMVTSNGTKILGKMWVRHGDFHREKGPAIIEYAPDGSEINVSFWEDGKMVMHKHDDGSMTYYVDERPSHTVHPDGRVDNHREFDDDWDNWQDNDGPEL